MNTKRDEKKNEHTFQMFYMFQLCFLLFQLTRSVKSTGKFSEIYYELNQTFVLQGRQSFFSEVESSNLCFTNNDCLEYNPNTICDRFFSELDSLGNFKYEGSFCVQKPIFEHNVELMMDPLEIGVRRCSNSHFCGENELCLASRLHRPYDGFCIKLNVCSRNRAASLSDDIIIPNHRWNCFDHSMSDAFSLMYFKNLTEVRSSNVHACCSEPLGGTCLYGNAIFPLKRCFEHSDCFKQVHEPTEWCDETSKLCCSDQFHDKSITCPDGLMYPFIEPKCTSYNENIPSSGSCPLENVNATCLHGHCCPAGEFSHSQNTNSSINQEKKFLFYKTTYETNIPCDPNQPIRRILWAYCDNLTRKIVVLSDNFYEKLKESKGNACNHNNDCEDSGSVCVWGSENKQFGMCVRDPLSVITFSKIMTYSLFGVSFASSFVFYIVTIVIRRKFQKLL